MLRSCQYSKASADAPRELAERLAWCVLRWTRSSEVEAIEVHDLVPCTHEVTHELLLRVLACVDLRDGSELGVRTEDEVDGGSGPPDLHRRAIATVVLVLGQDGRLPLRPHVEQARDEVVGQRLRP